MNKEIIEIADKVNKQIISTSKLIKEESKHLPDKYSLRRLNSYINTLNELIVELETLQNVIIKIQ